jgi:membrane protein YqaA with SNARE-associated domain
MGVAITIGALWGFGEATLFFVVPDVALTLLAILGPAPAWAACIAAVAGALVGGTVMYGWGARDTSRITDVLLRIPAIDEREVAGVRRGVERYGFGAVFLGPLRGTPYKLYAAEVGRRGLSLPLFLAISIPARGIRFVAATLLALWLADGPLEAWTPQATAALAVAFWVVFYATYFRLKGGSSTPCAPSV